MSGQTRKEAPMRFPRWPTLVHEWGALVVPEARTPRDATKRPRRVVWMLDGAAFRTFQAGTSRDQAVAILAAHSFGVRRDDTVYQVEYMLRAAKP